MEPVQHSIIKLVEESLGFHKRFIALYTSKTLFTVPDRIIDTTRASKPTASPPYSISRSGKSTKQIWEDLGVGQEKGLGAPVTMGQAVERKKELSEELESHGAVLMIILAGI